MADIYSMPGHLIRRLNQISTSIFHDRMKAAGHDLTSVQFAALETLSGHPGIDQATLAGLIAYDRATIGGVVDRLEGKRLIARDISPRDRRARVLTLTPEGEKFLAQVRPIVTGLQSDILVGLSEAERAEFIRLASRVAAEGNHLSRAPLLRPDPPDSD